MSVDSVRHRTAPPRQIVASAASVTVVCALPMFLTGALAIPLTRELGIARPTLGLAVGSFIGTQALLSAPLGGLADRIGASQALRIAATTAALAALTVAVVARSATALIAAMIVGGAANALAQPAASAQLTRAVRRDRQGIAFGVFQSAKPGASLLAGLSVPLIALTIGWRWAYAIAAVGALFIALRIPTLKGTNLPHRSHEDQSEVRQSALVVLLIATALGFGSSSVLATFLVDSAAGAGVAEGIAGLLLSLMAAMAIVARLTVGTFADRYPQSRLLRIAAFMMVTGATGIFLLGIPHPVAIVVGAVTAGAMGWGYNGIFFLAMTRLKPDSPATITGVTLAGGSAGGALAPTGFGALVEATSYAVAWTVTASCLLSAAALLMWARQLVLRSRNRTRNPE